MVRGAAESSVHGLHRPGDGGVEMERHPPVDRLDLAQPGPRRRSRLPWTPDHRDRDHPADLLARTPARARPDRKAAAERLAYLLGRPERRDAPLPDPGTVR